MLPLVMLNIKSGADPSPQSTQVAVISKPGSDTVKLRLTKWPGITGFGLMPLMDNVGGR